MYSFTEIATKWLVDILSYGIEHFLCSAVSQLNKEISDVQLQLKNTKSGELTSNLGKTKI